jgi:hypothetical protein
MKNRGGAGGWSNEPCGQGFALPTTPKNNWHARVGVWVDGWSDEPCGHRLALPTTPRTNSKKKDPYLASCLSGMKLGCMRLGWTC